MRYLSVCSGIEAASVAWHPLGWTPAAFAEIEPFPRAVLAHRFPAVPLHGDFTTIKGDEYGPIDLLVGGTPCQSFSVAGLRGGLADDRGNGDKPHVMTTAVRRLTPTECERLQGFPDGWTAIPWRGRADTECPDGPRYKALGNSMAVPCMRWIGERIQMVERLNDEG